MQIIVLGELVNVNLYYVKYWRFESIPTKQKQKKAYFTFLKSFIFELHSPKWFTWGFASLTKTSPLILPLPNTNTNLICITKISQLRYSRICEIQPKSWISLAWAPIHLNNCHYDKQVEGCHTFKFSKKWKPSLIYIDSP